MYSSQPSFASLKSTIALVSLAIIGIIVVSLAFGCFSIVGAGERGVLLTFGKPSDSILEEGFHFKSPFAQSIIKINVQVQKAQIETNAASKDMQDVTTSVAVNYHLDPSRVNILYNNIGLDYVSRVIDPAVREMIKAVSAQYTANELITQRESVKEKIRVMLKARLAKYDIIVDDFSIINFKFSAVYTKAIEAKQTAEQLAIKAQRDLERVKIEAEQKIAQARAEAESLKLQKTDLTPELLKLRAIEMQNRAIVKWDGHLPRITGGAMPFINVDQEHTEGN